MIRLEQLAETLNDCQVTLRGHGESTGYLTRVEILEQKVAKFVNGDFAKLKTELLQEIAKIETNILAKNAVVAAELKHKQEDDMAKTIQWPKLLSTVLPTIISVLNALLIAWAVSKLGPP